MKRPTLWVLGLEEGEEQRTKMTKKHRMTLRTAKIAVARLPASLVSKDL